MIIIDFNGNFVFTRALMKYSVTILDLWVEFCDVFINNVCHVLEKTHFSFRNLSQNINFDLQTLKDFDDDLYSL